MNFCSCSGENHNVRCRSVAIAPGTMQLTRMLRAPSSRARVARQPVDRRLCRRVSGKPGSSPHPRHRAEVDDRAAARAFHLRRSRLRGEELVPQIDGLVVVPVFGGHVVELVPVVARGIVDEYADRTEGPGRFGDRGLERAEIADVAEPVADGRAELCRKRARRRIRNVDEGNLAALARRMRARTPRRCRSRLRKRIPYGPLDRDSAPGSRSSAWVESPPCDQ